MDRKHLVSAARRLMKQPTAPFHEDAVRNEIVAQLGQFPHVRVGHDRFGNVIARYRRKTRRAARWAFAAHMDHPGWVRTKGCGWQFLGSVRENFLVNPRKREFEGFAMWDLPAFELKNGEIHSRACDDLIGCAEIICLFHELEAANADVHCLGIFSRAEEVGFWGAIQLARSKLIPKATTIFSLETSTPRGSAEIGRGPIVRVGDRLSIFDNAATAAVVNVARESNISIQRCLLDGGACEASAYQLYGYTAVAASVALGNYHNCAPNGTIQCEYVALEDCINMVRLCLALVLADSDPTDATRAVRQELEGRARGFAPFFRKLRG